MEWIGLFDFFTTFLNIDGTFKFIFFLQSRSWFSLSVQKVFWATIFFYCHGFSMHCDPLEVFQSSLTGPHSARNPSERGLVEKSCNNWEPVRKFCKHSGRAAYIVQHFSCCCKIICFKNIDFLNAKLRRKFLPDACKAFQPFIFRVRSYF